MSRSSVIVRAHPPGLALLFLTEMWERFSFYGMRALLVLYMTEQLLLSDSSRHVIGYPFLQTAVEHLFGPLTPQAMSSQIYGLYSSLLFFTPFFGGILADRWLGQFRTVILGGVVMALGHFLMAFDQFFLLALLCIILGNGCFKPNIATQVGNLYAPGDARRDSAFSIFYVGINLGAFIAPIVCGTLGEVYGWHYGFLAAGVGMLLGLMIFIYGRKYLPPDVRPSTEALRAASAAVKGLSAADRRAIVALCLVAFVITFFWASYEQVGNAVVLWVRDFTDRSVAGWFDLRITWFQSLNPLFIFTLTPLLLIVWARQARRRREPDVVTKLAIGCFLAALAYAVLTLAAIAAGPTGKAAWVWTVLFLALLTLGELHVSPVALSLFSRAAPARAASMMMGVWFMSGVVGNYLAGLLGSFWERLPKPMFWMSAAVVPLLAGFVVLALRRPLSAILLEQEYADQRAPQGATAASAAGSVGASHPGTNESQAHRALHDPIVRR